MPLLFLLPFLSPSRRVSIFVLTAAYIPALCIASGVSAEEDITNSVFNKTSSDCADYVGSYKASVRDESARKSFSSKIEITSRGDSCSIVSNNIPNHNFNDSSAHFAHQVQEVKQTFTVQRNPQLANKATALSQRTYNAVMLNGVPLDILSAGCYKPNGRGADRDGNVAIGCSASNAWLLDPLGTSNKFGADKHNAHTQPDGSYHYHGDPMAMFDSSTGVKGSPVIGFAADGFPVYGSYFLDASGELRKARSGYSLKQGSRGSKSDTNPGGNYDGDYIDDWQFTNTGDLDQCNGMVANGSYGYYVTETYPWVIKCFSGEPHASFQKAGMQSGRNGKKPTDGRPPKRHKRLGKKFPPLKK